MFPRVFESILDLDKQTIYSLLSLSQHFSHPLKHNPNDHRKLSKNQNIFPHSLVTMFFEDSTRTKLSFLKAAQNLGFQWTDFPTQNSSINKGETLIDTLKNLEAMGHTVAVIRSRDNEILKPFLQNNPLKTLALINGGDGINEHPTQVLLDLWSLLTFANRDVKNGNHFSFDLGMLEGKTLGIAGDIIHSRVAHSWLKLAPLLKLNLVFFGPNEFIPEKLKSSHIQNKYEFLSTIDFLYLLRIQFERHEQLIKEPIEQFKKNYLPKYGFTFDEVKEFSEQTQKFCPIFHPGPTNPGIECDRKLLESPLFFGLWQVSRSIEMRMAILTKMTEDCF